MTRCSECGTFSGEVNNLGQCPECSEICENCGVSANRETITDRLCKTCEEKQCKHCGHFDVKLFDDGDIACTYCGCLQE